MKKINLLIAFVLTLLGVSTASAEVYSPYTVDFNTAISTSTYSFTVAKGWDHIPDYYFDSESYDSYYPTYTYSSTGGRNGSGALKVSDQTNVGEGWSGGKTTDLLVTPYIKGKSSIYVKKAANNGTIAFYSVKQSSNGTLTKGSTIAVTLPELSTTDYVKVDIPRQDSARIGIYASNVWIDDFEADSALITKKRALKLSQVTNVLYRGSSTGNEDVDANGNFGMKFKVTIANPGDVDFAPGDEGYTLSVHNYADSVVATVPISQPLAAGAKLTDYELAIELPYAKYPKRDRYNVYEDVSGTSQYGAWIEPVPYTAVPNVSDDNGTVASGTEQAFGMLTQPVTKNYTLYNRGAAPLRITAIEIPEGFTTTLAKSDTVAAHQSKDFSITATNTATGIHSGNMVIKTEGASDYVLPLSATVLDTTKFYVNFEDGKFPTGFIVGENWAVKQRDYSTSSNVYFASSSLVDDTKLITPLLKVAEGEKMSIDVARNNAYSKDSHMNVYYSPDRKNWTLAKAIKAAEMSDDRGSTASYHYGALKTFVIDNVPAGNYYIAFEAGYASIDNIYGFERVDVDHDMLFTQVKMPSAGMVNNVYTATATVLNNNTKTEPAEGYKLELMVDGKTVATTASQTLKTDSTATFDFAFTPNKAGKYNAVIVLKAGDYEVVSDTAEITIAAETAGYDVQVGKVAATSNSDATPINVYYKYSVSDVIYTQQLLEASGLKKGDKITRISFKGYNKSGEVSTDVQAWIGNKADSTYASGYVVPDTTSLTKIANENHTVPLVGDDNDHQVLLSIDIPEGFVYNGQSIQMVMGSALTTTYKRAQFEYSADKPNGYSKRGDSQFKWSEAKATSYMPVPYFTVEKLPATLSGVVSSQAGNVSGAKVELRNGDVLYEAETDADGHYTMAVVQSDKHYAMTVTADGYDTYTDSVAFDTMNVEKNVVLTLSPDVIVVPECGWTTYSSDHAISLEGNLTAETDFTAYAVVEVTQEGAVIKPYDRSLGIPAGTGVIIKAPAGSYTFKRDVKQGGNNAPAKAEGNEMVNLLKPTVNTAVEVTANDNVYVFNAFSTTSVVGFGKAATGDIVPAHSAYLTISDSKALDFYPLIDGISTGIVDINAASGTIDENAPAYDLMGRRVDASYKGIVIQKGKKVLRK